MRRFWEKVDRRGPDECWPWLATRSNGYGHFYMDGAKVGAHRVAYELEVGPIPAEHHIDHLCENKACVNPAHLEAVLPGANVERTLARNPLCRQGHRLDGLKHDVSPNGTPRIRRYCRTCARASYHRRAAA